MSKVADVVNGAGETVMGNVTFANGDDDECQKWMQRSYPGMPEMVLELRRIADALEKAVKYVR